MKNILLIVTFVMSFAVSMAQTIASFEVSLPQSSNGMNVPVSISLKDLKSIPAESSMALVTMEGGKEVYHPFQLSRGKDKTLSWMIASDGPKSLSFQLIRIKKPPSIAVNVTGPIVRRALKMKITDKNGAYIAGNGNRNLLSYVYKRKDPPSGVDPAYGRSGFIHPLWTPHGQELTTIQPKDHYHHYGIWNPWTHVLFEGDTVDFWNIGGKQATVRYANLISKTEGDVFTEFKVLHEHVVLKKGSGEKKALKEIQTIRVFSPSLDYYILDITSELSCASRSPFHIVAYRYAGFGWRATEFWTKDNSEMLTSEGKTRDNTDGTKAKWLMVYGALPGNESGGIVMLSHPSNYNHPEPLRIWDKKANGGRGDVFANFAPTKDKDWKLEPGKTYTLKYRLVVFNGKFDAAKAESAWQYFANPAAVRVAK
jgi:hypothetical protein